MSGALMISISYGFDAVDDDDRWLVAAEKAMNGMDEMGKPGNFIGTPVPLRIAIDNATETSLQLTFSLFVGHTPHRRVCPPLTVAVCSQIPSFMATRSAIQENRLRIQKKYRRNVRKSLRSCLRPSCTCPEVFLRSASDHHCNSGWERQQHL